MNWRSRARRVALAMASLLACDGVDSRDPSVRDGGLGGSMPGGFGGGGTSGAGGEAAGSDAGGAAGGTSGAGAGGSGGAGSGNGGSGGACASGMKSCGAGVCVADGACCSDSDCGGPGVGACSDAQCSCVGSAFGASCTGRFIGLGVVGLVDSDSEARAISGDGRVVAGWSGVGTGQPRAARWLWESGQSESLGELQGGGTSIALALSRDGSVIVGDGSLQLLMSSSTGGFAWTEATGMDALAAGEFVQVSHAEAVTADGSTVVGWAIDDQDGIGARWDGLNGALLPVSSPPDSVRLFATNGTGSLFGGDAAGSPVTYAPGSSSDNFQVLNSGPFASGFVAAISPNGAHLAGTMDGGQAVRWFEGVGDPVELGAGLVRDVNDAGVVVGESEGVAVIWTAAGQRTEVLALLEAANVAARVGWTLQRAHGISDDGRVIVGAGTRSARQEAWLLRLPEAP